MALEGFLLIVDVANVTLEIGGDAEGAIAEFTPAGDEHVVGKERRHAQAAGGEESCAT